MAVKKRNGLVLSHFLKELKPRTTDKERLRQKKYVAFSSPKARERPLHEARWHKILKKGGAVKREEEMIFVLFKGLDKNRKEKWNGKG